MDPNLKYFWHGQDVCEDCYRDPMDPPKACDPTAVYLATRTRQQLGQEASNGLTQLQRSIYEFIVQKGRVTRDELIREFGLSTVQLEKELATLRHCELTRATKEGDAVYITTFGGGAATASGGRAE